MPASVSYELKCVAFPYSRVLSKYLSLFFMFALLAVVTGNHPPTSSTVQSA